MKLTLTDEQSLIAASAQDFLSREYGFQERARSLAAPHACEPRVWSRFAELGWLALAVPEDAGGLGAGWLEAGLLMRAFGRHLVVEPFAASALLVTPSLARLGNATQRERWLPALVEGRARAAFAHSEAAVPLAAQARQTVARREGKGWMLKGSKQLVTGAAGADLLLVSARDGVSRLFLVTPDTPGMHLRAVATADGSQAADIEFEDVRLGEDALLGGDHDVQDAVVQACARYLVALCWEASGAMAAAYEQTAAYVRQRVQFGKPLASFQVVQHRLAEMAVCCEEALAACELAALRIDAGALDAAELASMAKAKVGREARYVAQHSVQLHGAMGVTEELPVASWFRKLTAFAQQEGSTAAHAAAFGEAMLRSGAYAQSRTLAEAA